MKALRFVPFLLLALAAPAGAADGDLLKTKVHLGLASLADAIASEATNTTNHAARLALAGEISSDLEKWTRRFLPRVLQSFPSSADVCFADSLTREVNCSNSVTQSTVNGQVVAIYINQLALQP